MKSLGVVHKAIVHTTLVRLDHKLSHITLTKHFHSLSSLEQNHTLATCGFLWLGMRMRYMITAAAIALFRQLRLLIWVCHDLRPRPRRINRRSRKHTSNLGMGGTQNFVHGIYREKIPRYRVYRGTRFVIVVTLSLIHI